RSAQRRRRLRTPARVRPRRRRDAGDESLARQRRDRARDHGFVLHRPALRTRTRRRAPAVEARHVEARRSAASVLLGELHSIRGLVHSRSAVVAARRPDPHRKTRDILRLLKRGPWSGPLSSGRRIVRTAGRFTLGLWMLCALAGGVASAQGLISISGVVTT